jgi:hypothetical protein
LKGAAEGAFRNLQLSLGRIISCLWARWPDLPRDSTRRRDLLVNSCFISNISAPGGAAIVEIPMPACPVGTTARSRRSVQLGPDFDFVSVRASLPGRPGLVCHHGLLADECDRFDKFFVAAYR